MSFIHTGDEHITFEGMPTGHILSDFWRWSSSDLLNNTLRGAYAEFLVAAALGLELDKPREDWTPYDLDYGDKRIEVKSAAYLQAWGGDRLSSIQFSVRPTRAWYPDTGYAGEVIRQSDLYIFCLYSVQDSQVADPLCLDGWDFYVLPTKILDEQCADQKSLTLSALLLLHPTICKFDGIKRAINSL